jgi:hypothetical protein
MRIVIYGPLGHDLDHVDAPYTASLNSSGPLFVIISVFSRPNASEVRRVWYVYEIVGFLPLRLTRHCPLITELLVFVHNQVRHKDIVASTEIECKNEYKRNVINLCIDTSCHNGVPPRRHPSRMPSSSHIHRLLSYIPHRRRNPNLWSYLSPNHRSLL